MCGGSTALFVYGYCFYYYYARSGMSGFMQTSFFFGYNLMVRPRAVGLDSWINLMHQLLQEFVSPQPKLHAPSSQTR
jgi:hypothetical protein